MTCVEKSHDTALRIIEVLKILIEEDIHKHLFNEKLSLNNDKGNACSRETYSKYFNTLEVIGLPVLKDDNFYYLKNTIIKIDLTKEEENLLINMVRSIPKLNNIQQEETLKKLILKIDKYVDIDLRKEVKKLETNYISNSLRINFVNTLKQIMQDNTETTITYSKVAGHEETFENVSIKKISEKNGSYYVILFNQSMQRRRRICVDNITSIKQSPKKVNYFEPNNTVIYEVYGRLSKSYKIKQWETMIDYGQDFMRISNTMEDYETLLPRLLKYGENCKIIKPKNIVDDFLSLTNAVLLNLGETVCQK